MNVHVLSRRHVRKWADVDIEHRRKPCGISGDFQSKGLTAFRRKWTFAMLLFRRNTSEQKARLTRQILHTWVDMD